MGAPLGGRGLGQDGWESEQTRVWREGGSPAAVAAAAGGAG